MKLGRPWSLRAQIGAAMSGSVVLAVAFGYFGLTAFGQWQHKTYLAQLDPKLASIYAKAENGIVPTQEEVAIALKAELTDQTDFQGGQHAALAVLASIAVFISFMIGVIISRAAALPLEQIARAAREVAQGNLLARADPSSGAPGEIKVLIDDFNSMAKALESYDRESRESSAAIAHELRTPLTILRGRLQAHYDGVFKWSENDAKVLIEQVDALSHIVDDLQVVSLGATGQLITRQEICDLADIARSLINTLEPAYTLDGWKIEANLVPTFAFADPQRVRQATLALTENARRHARLDAGGQNQTIYIETRIKTGDATLAVMDRGPGLPTGQEHLVLERFWRADNSRARALGGSGLGLSVVTAIVSALTGKVVAVNRQGGGAAFIMRFKSALPK